MREVAEGVWTVTAGTFPSNTYICATNDGEAILIDAGLDAAAIESTLLCLNRKPTHIFCTHGHFDHLGSAAYIQKKFETPVALHTADFKTARTNNFLLMAIKREERIKLPTMHAVEDGYTAEFGSRLLRFHHTPGHTPGSCVISLGEHLFTGDTIYSRGLGLSKLPGERHEQLRESILRIWSELGSYCVHPGHGPSAAGAEIMRRNTALLSFLGLSKEDLQVVWDGSDVESGL